MKNLLTPQTIVNIVLTVVLTAGFLYFMAGAYKFLMKKYRQQQYNTIEIKVESEPVKTEPDQSEPNAFVSDDFFDNTGVDDAQSSPTATPGTAIIEDESYDLTPEEALKIEDLMDRSGPKNSVNA